jgi:ankyrin repeat protein
VSYDEYTGPAYVAPACDDEIREKLFEAVGEGDVEALQSLLDEGAPAGVLDDDGNSLLHKAAEGESECARAVLSQLDSQTLAPVLTPSSGFFETRNSDEKTALLVAIEYEDATIVELLVKAGSLVTEEAASKANDGGVPEVITAVTGQHVAERRSQVYHGGKRASVSGSGIEEYTDVFKDETQSLGRRASVAGASNQSAALDAALLVPEKPEEDEDEPAS